MGLADAPSNFRTTAGEISRNFGYWQDQAISGPVTVTSHGRPRVVMLSVQEFERLSQAPSRPDSPDSGGDDSLALTSLLEHMSEGFIALDADLRITAINPTVEAFIGQAASQLIGRNIDAVEGEGAGVLNDRYRWVLRSGEKITFEATSYIRPDRHISVQAFPWRGGVGVMFANRTELSRLRSEREGWQALQAALDASAAVMTAEMTPLGFFTKANALFADFLGFREEQLSQARLTDLVATSDRQAVAQALNALVARKTQIETVEAAFLTRDHGRQSIRFSLAPTIQDAGCTSVVLAAQTPPPPFPT